MFDFRVVLTVEEWHTTCGYKYSIIETLLNQQGSQNK